MEIILETADLIILKVKPREAGKARSTHLNRGKAKIRTKSLHLGFRTLFTIHTQIKNGQNFLFSLSTHLFLVFRVPWRKPLAVTIHNSSVVVKRGPVTSPISNSSFAIVTWALILFIKPTGGQSYILHQNVNGQLVLGPPTQMCISRWSLQGANQQSACRPLPPAVSIEVLN